MNIRLDELRRAIALPASIAPSNPVKPVLASLYIRADGGRTTISATDLYTGVTSSAPDESDDTADILVNASRFSGIVKGSSAADESMVALDVDGTRLRVTTADGVFHLSIGEPDEFPHIPTAENSEGIPVSAARLNRAISHALPCTARVSDQYNMSGIAMATKGGKLYAVGTDTHRLAICEIADCKPTANIIVNQKSAQMIAKMAASSDGQILLVVEANMAIAASPDDGDVIYCSLIEDAYPKWEKIIPDIAQEVTVSADALRSALRQASVTADDTSHDVGITITAGEMSIQSTCEGGDAKITIPATSPVDLTLHINHNYLLQAVKPIEETVVIEITDANHPIVVRDAETWDPRAQITMISPIMPKNLE